MKKPAVLIVEDSHTVSQVIRDTLLKHGYPVFDTLTTGEEAIGFARDHRPDIVLMDIWLGGALNGMAAAETITREYDIPVIFLTAASDVAMLEGALKSDCSTYLIKPVQEAELIINLEIALQKTRAARDSDREHRWREAILDGLIDAVLAIDENGQIIYMNTPAMTLLEVDCLQPSIQLHELAQFFSMDGVEAFVLENPGQNLEYRLVTRAGTEHVVLAKTRNLYDPILETQVRVVAISNITDEWMMQERIRYMTFHDSLTGLYNRNFLEEELVRLNTERQHPISIIMADLNGLKIINDILGHVEGDLLLKTCAVHLREACREEDIIARFGGDEFLVFLPKTSEDEVRQIVKRIQSVSREVITPLGPMSVALGHYTKQALQETMQTAIIKADEDMYKEKVALKKNYYQNCFDFAYCKLQEHPFEGKSFTNQVICLMEQLLEQTGDHNGNRRDIHYLGRVYDIGMICLPSHIYKYSRFKEGDWEQIQRHAEISYKIVNLNPKYAPVADAVLYHHERWDGRGYPYHLKGDGIPMLARMLAIVDAYCSMIRPRHYRQALTPRDALIEISKGAGTQFDPQVVDQFITLIGALEAGDKT